MFARRDLEDSKKSEPFDDLEWTDALPFEALLEALELAAEMFGRLGPDEAC